MKKRLLIGMILNFMILIFLTVGAAAAGNHSEWAAESIDRANRAGLIPQQQYLSDYTKPINRGNLAALIAQAYENTTGKTYQAKSAPFTDAWGSDIAIVYELGIMTGKGENEFAPYDSATREEMAKIILSFQAAVEKKKLILPQPTEAVFTDFESISDWAKPYVIKANAEKIMNGYDDGSFGGSDTVSWEQAIAMVTRTVDLKQKEKPVITSLEWDTVVSSDEDLKITFSEKGTYEIYGWKQGGHTYSSMLGSCYNGKMVQVNAGRLDADSLYYICAEQDGVFSEPIRIYTDQYHLFIQMEDYAPAGKIKIQWNRIPGEKLYLIQVTEKRNSRYEGDIPPNEPRIYEIRWEDFYHIETNPNRTYTVAITAGDYHSTRDIYIVPNESPGAEEIANHYPQTKEEAEALMTTVAVPVWKIRGSQKVASTAYITVHHLIAERTKLVFEEIFNGPEKFPIKDVGGYSWRGGRSEHNGGTAIDINAYENYCIYSDGTTIGSYWKPYEDPYSITPYGDVMRAFEKYGFTWGGDAWSNPKDYMHFSYLGT